MPPTRPDEKHDLIREVVEAEKVLGELCVVCGQRRILSLNARSNSVTTEAMPSVGNSVSEFISNQLSYWITQLDQNLQVNLDLGAIDQKAINTFQLTLSYSLAQGRLRITRAGNIYADQTNNDVSSIIGDWTLEYMLTRDGNLRAKMYNKFNANSVITNTLGGYYNSTGFSLMQTKGFDRFNELFARKNNSRKNSRHYTEYDEGVIPSDKTSRDQKNSVPVP